MKSCLICCKIYKKDESRSFHMFPRNVELRRKWFDVLQIINQDMSIYSYICSDHFKPEDIYVAPTGKRFLKRFTVPSIFPKEPISAASSYQGKTDCTSQSYEGCSLTSTFQTPLNSDTETASETMEIERSNAADILNRYIDAAESSDTEKTESKVVDLEQSPPKKKKHRLHYYGDVHSSDFYSPHKSKRSWEIIKSTISKQKKQIINLQQSRRRLKRRISCLNSVLKYLSQNHLISENAESAIQSALPGVAGEIFKKVLNGSSRQKYNASL